MGLSEGFLGSYWFFPQYTNNDGYDLEGVEPTVKDLTTKEVMFNSP